MGILPDWMIETGVKITPMAPCQTRPGVISFGLTSYGYDARTGFKFQVFTPNPKAAVVVDPKAFDPRALVEVDLTPQDAMGTPLRNSAGEYMSRKEVLEVYRDGGREPPADHVIIPPHSFALAETLEYVEIPRDCLCIVVGKSTYARCGIIAPLTPLEPEWRGKITVEIGNTTPLPAKVYAGEGFIQLCFFRSAGFGETTFNLLMAHLREDHRIHQGEEIDLLREKLRRGVNGTCRLSYADKKGRYNDQAGITHPSVD